MSEKWYLTCSDIFGNGTEWLKYLREFYRIVMRNLYIYIYMQNSLLSLVVAIHLVSTIRSTTGSMKFPSGITRTHRWKQQCLQILSISHHLLNTATQHTTTCNLLASPPNLTWHTRLLHHPFKPSNQNHHTIQPYNLTCSSHCSHLYTQLPLLYV
jgi:hypothetical protein